MQINASLLIKINQIPEESLDLHLQPGRFFILFTPGKDYWIIKISSCSKVLWVIFELIYTA